jgi:hypothetical protein
MRDIIIELTPNSNLKDFSLFMVDLMAKRDFSIREKRQQIADYYLASWLEQTSRDDDYILFGNYPIKCIVGKRFINFLRKLFCKNLISICLDLSQEEFELLIQTTQSFGLKAKESNYRNYDKKYGYMWRKNKEEYYLHSLGDGQYSIRNKNKPLTIYNFPEYSAARNYVIRKMLAAGVEVRE